MYRTCLICVDVQKDFLPGGALGVPHGDEIIHPLALAARDADIVIASADRHEKNDNSFEKRGGPWPPHCIVGTPGQRIHPAIRKLANYTISKGTDPDGADDYSVFTGHTLRPVSTLTDILDRHEIEQVIVGGLAMDYCVKFTALDANASGFRTIVPLNLTRPITEEGYRVTLLQFDRAGVIYRDNWSD